MITKLENFAATFFDSNGKEQVKVNKKLAYYFIKRSFDILLSLIGLCFLLPLIFIVKIIFIFTGDFKSMLYTQKRIGKNGREFKLLKIRSMIPNADLKLKELLENPIYKKEWEENQKLKNDPRITKIGNILRKTSLDEVPQLLNILKGDMSFIGPRPLVKGELDAHNGNHNIYEKIKPGLTGWWASHGRSDTTYEERLELEYYYIENQSLLLDIKCIFETIKIVILKTGAK